MTTLIIEVPDIETEDISNIVRSKGGNIVHTNTDDEDLIFAELELLKKGLKKQ